MYLGKPVSWFLAHQGELVSRRAALVPILIIAFSEEWEAHCYTDRNFRHLTLCCLLKNMDGIALKCHTLDLQRRGYLAGSRLQIPSFVEQIANTLKLPCYIKYFSACYRATSEDNNRF